MPITEATASQLNIEAVEVLEEKPGSRTGGHFRAVGVDLVVAAGTPGVVQDFDITWPIPVSIMAAEIDVAPEWIGDRFDVLVAPETVIGTTAQLVDVGATVVPVSDTVIAALENNPEHEDAALHYHVGYLAKVGSEDSGHIVAVDPVAKTITVENALSAQAGAGTAIAISVAVAENCKFTVAGVAKSIGESKIGGSYIAAGRIVRIRYTNGDGLAKTVSLIFEILY
jgi:hypothetical protein